MRTEHDPFAFYKNEPESPVGFSDVSQRTNRNTVFKNGALDSCHCARSIFVLSIVHFRRASLCSEKKEPRPSGSQLPRGSVLFASLSSTSSVEAAGGYIGHHVTGYSDSLTAHPRIHSMIARGCSAVERSTGFWNGMDFDSVM